MSHLSKALRAATATAVMGGFAFAGAATATADPTNTGSSSDINTLAASLSKGYGLEQLHRPKPHHRRTGRTHLRTKPRPQRPGPSEIHPLQQRRQLGRLVQGQHQGRRSDRVRRRRPVTDDVASGQSIPPTPDRWHAGRTRTPPRSSGPRTPKTCWATSADPTTTSRRSISGGAPTADVDRWAAMTSAAASPKDVRILVFQHDKGVQDVTSHQRAASRDGRSAHGRFRRRRYRHRDGRPRHRYLGRYQHAGRSLSKGYGLNNCQPARSVRSRYWPSSTAGRTPTSADPPPASTSSSTTAANLAAAFTSSINGRVPGACGDAGAVAGDLAPGQYRPDGGQSRLRNVQELRDVMTWTTDAQERAGPPDRDPTPTSTRSTSGGARTADLYCWAAINSADRAHPGAVRVQRCRPTR